MARNITCSKHQPIFNLSKKQLYQEAYDHLQRKRLFSSCAILQQIISREQKKYGQDTVVARLGNLIASDSLNPRFLSQLINMLPTHYREVLGMVVAFGFMHRLDVKAVENHLVNGMEAFLKYPNVVRSSLVQLVLAQNDEVFLFLANRMDAKYFYFTVGEMRSLLLTQSENESWPPNATSLIKANALFLAFVEECGTDLMKAWAKVFTGNLFRA